MEEKFRFLTVEEFDRLSQRQKISYLDEAAEVDRRMRRRKSSLFRPGTPHGKNTTRNDSGPA
jgi:hypothetical protein